MGYRRPRTVGAAAGGEIKKPLGYTEKEIAAVRRRPAGAETAIVTGSDYMPTAELNLPEMTGVNLDKLTWVVYQVVEKLNYLLNNLDGANISAGGIGANKIHDFGNQTINVLKAEIARMEAGAIDTQYLSAAVSEIAMARIRMAKIDVAQVHDLTAEIIRVVVANLDEVNAGTVITNELFSQIIMAITGELEKVSAGLVQTNELHAAIISAVQAELENLLAGTISTNVIEAVKADIEKLDAGELYAAIMSAIQADILALDIGKLYAAVAELVRAVIMSADIDMLAVKDLIAGEAIITRGVGGDIYIARLNVNEGNFVSVTAGELILKGPDGRFYTVEIDGAGNVKTTEKVIGNENIDDNSIAGMKIIEGSILATQLNVTEIFTSDLLAEAITAANIDVESLFASEAYIGALKTHLIQSDYLSLVISEMPDVIGKLAMFFDFTSEGLVIRQPGSEFWQMTSGEEIAFYQGGVKVAYFTNSKMYTPSLEVDSALSVGRFRWVIEKNGSMSLVYV